MQNTDHEYRGKCWPGAVRASHIFAAAAAMILMQADYSAGRDCKKKGWSRTCFRGTAKLLRGDPELSNAARVQWTPRPMGRDQL